MSDAMVGDLLHCDQCEYTAAKQNALAMHKRRKHPRPLASGGPVADDDPSVATVADASAAEGESAPTRDDAEEIAPRKPRLIERIRNRRGRGVGGGHPAPAPGERAPKRKRVIGRRVALDMDISDLWAFGGRRLEVTPHFATGRMLQYQAPAAGVIIDRAIAGTLPDRVLLQPLARNRDKYEDVGFLLAGPILTFTITATGMQLQAAIQEGDQETAQVLMAKLQVQKEMFTWVLTMMLPRLAAGAKLAREKKAKRDAAIADAFPDLGDQDPAEVLANLLFAPPSYQEGPPQNGKADSNSADVDRKGTVAH